MKKIVDYILVELHFPPVSKIGMDNLDTAHLILSRRQQIVEWIADRSLQDVTFVNACPQIGSTVEIFAAVPTAWYNDLVPLLGIPFAAVNKQLECSPEAARTIVHLKGGGSLSNVPEIPTDDKDLYHHYQLTDLGVRRLQRSVLPRSGKTHWISTEPKDHPGKRFYFLLSTEVLNEMPELYFKLPIVTHHRPQVGAYWDVVKDHVVVSTGDLKLWDSMMTVVSEVPIQLTEEQPSEGALYSLRVIEVGGDENYPLTDVSSTDATNLQKLLSWHLTDGVDMVVNAAEALQYGTKLEMRLMGVRITIMRIPPKRSGSFLC